MAGAALLRLQLLYRMLRVGELLALLAFVSWTSWYVPSAVAGVLRLAGSLLLNARFVFVLGNAIVLLLFALSRHEHNLSSSSAASSSTDDDQPAAATTSTATTTTTTTQERPPSTSIPPVAATDSVGFVASFTTPPPTTTTPPSSSDIAVKTGTTATSFLATPAAPPREREDKHLMIVAQRGVNRQARAPRRSRSEKMTAPRRAASPELRRCESENGRRRRSSVTARDAEACWGREDADAFRQQVEAFIARQTRFHREESLRAGGHCDPAPAFTAALAVVE